MKTATTVFRALVVALVACTASARLALPVSSRSLRTDFRAAWQQQALARRPNVLPLAYAIPGDGVAETVLVGGTLNFLRCVSSRPRRFAHARGNDHSFKISNRRRECAAVGALFHGSQQRFATRNASINPNTYALCLSLSLSHYLSLPVSRSIYNALVTARILLSWFPQAQGIAALRPLYLVTDPFLNLFRGLGLQVISNLQRTDSTPP
jgi:uncharacterized protein YggT (Ycf19 family)